MRLLKSDYENIVAWLEVRENFNSLFGAGKKTKVNGKVRSKMAMVEQLAKHVNENSHGRLSLSGTVMYQRLRNFKDQFVKAVIFQKQTDASITAADRKKGISTMSQKLETICPFFTRMDSLFGDKPEITPLAEYDSSQPVMINETAILTGTVDDQQSGMGSWERMDEGLEMEEFLERSEVEEFVERPAVEEIPFISEVSFDCKR